MNTRDNYGYNKSRFRQTLDFIGDIQGDVLDIGERNHLTDYLEERLALDVYNTFTDLDYRIDYRLKEWDYYVEKQRWEYGFDYVFCFEVIEHLLNPRLFFDNLRKHVHKDTRIFLSYPSRPKILWNDQEHFHEYDKLRFNYLLKKTGFKIVRQKNIYVRRKPTGIRPLLRNFIPLTVIYELRLI